MSLDQAWKEQQNFMARQAAIDLQSGMNPFRDKTKLWDPRFSVLATYNGEVARGIVHTEAWTKKMITLQEEYNAKLTT